MFVPLPGPGDHYVREKEFARQQKIGPDSRATSLDRVILSLGAAGLLVLVVVLINWLV